MNSTLEPKKFTNFLRSAIFCAIGFCGIHITLVSHHGWKPTQYTAILLHLKSGQVLYSYAPHTLVHPASLTKMQTLYVMFSALKQNKPLASRAMACAEAAQQQPSKLGIKCGESISLHHALLGAGISSHNDLAFLLPKFLGASRNQFVDRMNAACRKIGMRNTRFYNTSGLPHPHQVTTAYDMMLLLRQLWIEFPSLTKRYLGSDRFAYKQRMYRTTNRLMRSMPCIRASKTGFTTKSGFNLAVLFEKEGEEYIAVIIGGKSSAWRFSTMRQIIEVAPNLLAQSKKTIMKIKKKTRKPRQKPRY